MANEKLVYFWKVWDIIMDRASLLTRELRSLTVTTYKIILVKWSWIIQNWDIFPYSCPETKPSKISDVSKMTSPSCYPDQRTFSPRAQGSPCSCSCWSWRCSRCSYCCYWCCPDYYYYCCCCYSRWRCWRCWPLRWSPPQQQWGNPRPRIHRPLHQILRSLGFDKL